MKSVLQELDKLFSENKDLKKIIENKDKLIRNADARLKTAYQEIKFQEKVTKRLSKELKKRK